jgi:hypothetical protein
MVGVLGAGKIFPDYEEVPPNEKRRYEIMLALRDENRAYYSNEIRFSKAIPFGAGMCILKSMADKYVCPVSKENFRLPLTGPAMHSFPAGMLIWHYML